jgi:hypothetical protein
VAVGVLREGVDTAEREAGAVAVRTAAFNPFAIAIPLSLVGGVMLVLFPPVGLMLFATAIAAMVWGVATILFARR